MAYVRLHRLAALRPHGQPRVAVLLAVDSDQARRTPRRVAREKQTAPLKTVRVRHPAVFSPEDLASDEATTHYRNAHQLDDRNR
jgi:hypothetical protein